MVHSSSRPDISTTFLRQVGRVPIIVCFAAGMLAACGRSAEQVGAFSNDWTGNEIKVEAVHDPDIPGVVCHMTYFDRSVFDRLRQGNWFENPSNTSIACQRIGALDLSQATLRKSGEEVFSQRQSLFFKNVAVRRILDLPNRTILYVSHSRQVVDGSAKMSLSSVALTDEDLATLSRKVGQLPNATSGR